eukprot:Plantae.Rhodophyta-Hildenbrandia_rubra.ctg59028.p2 GENE.Plantae.Rhodophyta-Hildenbrandia_rubra.ctg59028~~Plantae.Rhodophyta-Hildenbrandia_rubra.ctg59028.p2  ORF type:complete len:103 (+),score=11.70 Plantae.Rhodophyta-Hildenbrandia_rubra.ctg59028:26-334(+)
MDCNLKGPENTSIFEKIKTLFTKHTSPTNSKQQQKVSQPKNIYIPNFTTTTTPMERSITHLTKEKKDEKEKEKPIILNHHYQPSTNLSPRHYTALENASNPQ